MIGRTGTAYLLVGGKKFHSTCQSKRDAEDMVERAGKHNHKLVMRNYGVRIHTVNPDTHAVLTWDKCKGYSVWE